jgi:hypothetical protein
MIADPWRLPSPLRKEEPHAIEPAHKIISYKSFRHPSDCGPIVFSQSGLMPMQGEAIITQEDKVDVLRRLDARWPSLNHRICCTHCGRVFAAGEIAVLGGSRGFGPLRLHCPNEACKATPAEWISAGRDRSLRQSLGGQIAKVSTTHNGRVFRVRRSKLARRREELATTERGSFSHLVATTLHRLDRGWAHLRRRTLGLFRTAA